jgi:acyl dehydratase
MDYFEDLSEGETVTAGSRTVTAEEIVAFAEQYDPQPFHLDEEAAAQSPFGGLVASGWHTAALTMRLLVDGILSETASQGALGVDELRWHRPVRPGDELAVETEIESKEPWSDEAGLARVRIETSVDDDLAMSMVGLVLFGRRE